MNPARPLVSLALAAALATLAAGTGLSAKEMVNNPAVKARIDAMESFRSHMKVLSNMAKGTLDYSPAQAAEAAAGVQAAAITVAPLFETEAHDPASNAKPGIWADFAAFSGKAEALVQAAAAIDAGSLEGVQASVERVGVTCKSCHDDYKKD
jgi:cytochrome c556